MCKPALKSGWLVTYVAAMKDGYSIEFLNLTDGFGDLKSATVFAEPDQPLFATQSWVHTDDLGKMLLEMMQDRADLMWLPDFQAYSSSEEGAPLIWQHVMLCRSCGHEQQEVFDAPRRRARCAKCRSIIEVHREMVEWVGPSLPVLQELWEKLPPVGIETVSLGNGFRARTISSGIVVIDDLGNRVELSNDDDGLAVTLRHAVASTEFHITIDAEGIGLRKSGERK